MVEKILARATGSPGLRAGDDVLAAPDFVLAYVFGGFSKFPSLVGERFGVSQLAEPERFALFLDHNIPVTDARLESRIPAIKAWCAAMGMAVYDGEGIGHVVASEAGYATPGAFAVHFDGHISQLGAFGTLAIGVHLGIYEAFARPAMALRVPETVQVRLTGALRPGVFARDVVHHLIHRHGADFCNSRVLELSGPGLGSLSLDDLQTITGLAMFTGALTAIAEPTPAALAYAAPRARKRLAPVFPDMDARYSAGYACDLAEVETFVAAPPSSANLAPLSTLLGRPIQVGYLGSCVSGRLSELRVAARMLKGRRIAPGFVLNVVPSTASIAREAEAEGLLQVLSEAGASPSPSTCSFCYGAVGALTDGQRAISSGTLNIPGRMGSPRSEIYLANAAVVAATALAGEIADPAPYL